MAPARSVWNGRRQHEVARIVRCSMRIIRLLDTRDNGSRGMRLCLVTITVMRMMEVADVRGSAQCAFHRVMGSGRSNAATIIRLTPDSPHYQGTECQERMNTVQAMPHVVILGGGFGGLWATRALRSAPVRITLADRTNHHLFQPLLYQMATAGLSGPDIAAPLRHILRKQRNVTVRMDEARSIDVQQRQVTLAGGTLNYDYLLVATGSSHAYFGHDEWERHAPGMKTMDDALAIRRHILDAFESAEREPDPVRRAAWLSFVVIGAGPTGVELAGTLAEIAHHTLPSEFRVADPRTAQIYLVEAGARVLSSMPLSLSVKAQRQLELMGVHVHLNAAVTAVSDTGVQMGDQRIEARTLLWAAGVAASSLGAQLGAPCKRRFGRSPVAGQSDERKRTSGAVYTMVRASNIGSTRPVTEMQSDIRCTPNSADTHDAAQG
jgi:NADH dehydrogenase FAD-containing subunit